MSNREEKERIALLQGTLDLLILRSWSLARNMDKASPWRFSGIPTKCCWWTMGRCTLPCKGLIPRNGSVPSGACRRTTGVRAFTLSQPRAVTTWSKRPASGARWPPPWHAFSTWKSLHRRRAELCSIAVVPHPISPRNFRPISQIDFNRLRAEGLSEKEAYHAARRNLGNLGLAGERFYETSRWMWLEHLLSDLRYSVRRLIKAPAFAITAILTLALGIGATTSIFTLVNAVLLKSLPVANPDQLYRVGKEIDCCVWGGYGQGGRYSPIFSHDLYKHLRDNAQGSKNRFAFQAGQSLLGVRRARTSNTADTYIGEFVSGNYFSMFGMPAYAGRAFLPSDDREGAPPVALMSYRVWQQKYSLDPSIIGETFHLNDAPFTIVGITPPGFYGETLRPYAPDFFMPLADEPLLQRDNSLLHQVNSHWLEIIGRLAPGASAATAEGQLRVSLQQWLQSHVGEMSENDRSQMANEKIFLSPGGSGVTSMRDDYKDWLKILLAVTGFVLLIVCANRESHAGAWHGAAAANLAQHGIGRAAVA